MTKKSNYTKFRKNLLILAVCLHIFFVPKITYGFTFTNNFLISDADLTNYLGLSLKGIQKFLEEKGSVLANYFVNNKSGEQQKVSEIIYDAAHNFKLNPMLFLVMAQKESSAITSTKMSYAIKNWLLGYGRCDGCSEASAEQYRGIVNQLYAAGERFRNSYLNDLETRGYTISGWGPGIAKTTIDGIVVTPRNNATAALYTYNPCVGAYGGGYSQYGCNSAFQKIWQEWNPNFFYPTGTLLQVDKVVYLIQGKTKRPFTSRAALVANFNTKNIIPVSITVAERYEDGTPIFFPNYSLLKNPVGTVYLYVDGKKRGFKTQDMLRKMGFSPELILDVNWREIDRIPEGKPITTAIVAPQGELLQDKKTGAVVYIDEQRRRHDIIDRSVLTNRFPYRRPLAVESKVINKYEKAEEILMEDGTLISSKSDGAVYVVSEGKKRPFVSAEVFSTLGYEWKNIIFTTEKVLNLHPTGKKINF